MREIAQRLYARIVGCTISEAAIQFDKMGPVELARWHHVATEAVEAVGDYQRANAITYTSSRGDF